MKRILLLGTICLLAFSSLSAQELYNSSGARVGSHPKKKQEKGFDPQKLIFGGGLGLSFGDVTQLSVAPMVGYRITDKLSAGVGLGYQYLKVKDYIPLTDINGYTNWYDYKASILYPSIWARYVVWSNLFVHAELEHDFQTFTDYGYDPSGNGSIVSFKDRYNNNALLLGAGFRQPVTDRSSFVIMALYDVLQDKYSPYYGRLEFRFGFNVGF